jgi:hypothetical protein
MARPTTSASPATVSDYLHRLAPPLRVVVEAVRQTILATDPAICEQIKWNSPSFYYSGAMPPSDPREYRRDIVVMNLHRGYLLLVFPSGAALPPHPLLEGNYADGRRLVTIRDLADAQAKADALQQVLGQWLATVAPPG